jgi:MoxR-like ATPase
MLLHERIKRLIEAISYQVYEKEEIFSLAMLAMLGEESIFLLGKPGIAKSLISRRLKFAINGGRNFEYLMSKFSTPEEIYGPIDLKQLKEGKYIRVLDGYLPTAHVGFLDEIWKAGPSIQNTLLTIINEKIFRNGGVDVKVPLKLLISASNELPAEGEGLEALFDRFIIRYIAKPLEKEENFDQLLDGESSLDVKVDQDLSITVEELEEWKRQSKQIRIGKSSLDFIHYFRNKIVRDTNGEAYISDRRWKKISGLMKTSAFFNGRMQTDIPDLFVIPFCIWDDEEQEEKYKKIFFEAFLERFGIEWRQKKSELTNQLDVLNDEINQVETQLLRITPYENPFRGKLEGTFYRIDYVDGQEDQRACMISASEWNKISALPNEEFDVTLFFGADPNKNPKGQSQVRVRASRSAQITFVNEGRKYNLVNDNPVEFNNRMQELNQQIQAIEQEVRDVSAEMIKEYKKFKSMPCIFFESVFTEYMAQAFDSQQRAAGVSAQEFASDDGEF